MHGSKRRYEQLEPQLQRDIAADYQRGVRGHGLRALANTYQLPIPTVQHVVARATQAGGDPDAPRGRKRRKLDEVDEAKLCRTLDPERFRHKQKDRGGCCWQQNFRTKCECLSSSQNHASQQRLFKIRNLRNCQRSGRQKRSSG